MAANDWEAAASFFAEGFVVDWPCSGERISRREDFIAVQREYPAAAAWRFDIDRLVVERDVAVTELTVSDGTQAARAIGFSEIHDGRIKRQVEYWPVAYDAPAWRKHLVQQIEKVP